MNQKLQDILNLLEQNKNLSAEEKESLLKSLKDANKELMITAFKLERTEKVKKTTAILLEETIEELEQKRIAVEAQNHELEIEASLERVRAVAMGMNKSDDLLSICEVSFKEFKKLGFDNIRNALIHIQYDNQKYFMDYDFSDLTGGAITKIEYGSHPVVEDYLRQIRSAKDAFYQGVIKEDQLEEWKDFRRNSGQIDDPRLDKATALYYYFFSIGIGDIGISTLEPINASQIKILKRFRNVFDLAYRRYNDITLAEEQAREAQIQLALERVRARSMAMHKSGELLDVITVVSEQLENLGFKFDIVSFAANNQEYDYNFWMSVKGQSHPYRIHVPYINNPMFELVKQAQYKGDTFYADILTREENKQWHQHLFEHNKLDFITDKLKKYVYNSGYARSIVLLPKIMLMVGNYSSLPYSDEENNIIKRFANVFDQVYTRFLDLQKAEAQAREAKIETALERIRSRTMGMQKSVELKDVIRVVYEQFVHLKINVDHAGFVVDYTPKGDWHFWIADEQDIPSKITHPYFESVWANQFNEAKEKGADFFATNLNFEEKNKFYNELLSHVPGLPEASKDFYLSCPGLAATTVLFDNVSLYIENFSGIPYTDEENNMLMRFGKVFQQTYTRFLDLQKAEAQARESQIEAALERVRSRTMAMQRSDELAETVSVLFKQLLDLGVKSTQLRTCGIVTFKENEPMGEIWITDITGEIISDSFYAPYDEAPAYKTIYSRWKSGEKFLELNLKGDAFLEHLKFVKKYSAVPNINLDEIKKSYTEIFMHVIYFSQGYLFIISYEALTEFHGIFKRFGALFHQTYTRFLDFKKVEAQNKIIQAENDRKTKELEEARQLQLSMLPKKLPQLPNMDIAVYMKTATEVGGDYYDFNIQENGVLNIGFGDATGHGLQAGTMITLMKGFFTSDAARFSPPKFLENCNGLIRDIKLGRILMSFSHLRFENNSLLMSSAGMPPIYYHHKINNRTEEIIIQGLPLGALQSASYKLVEKKLNADDTILLLTDGLPEQMNSQKVIFDYSRVLKYFDEIADNSPQDIINRLVEKADSWMSGQQQTDDITFVVIKIK